MAFIGLGFVVSRFGLFLRALGAQAGTTATNPQASALIGVGLVLIGVLVAVLSLIRYRQVARSIEAGHFQLDVSIELITAAATIFAGGTLAAYLMVTR